MLVHRAVKLTQGCSRYTLRRVSTSPVCFRGIPIGGHASEQESTAPPPPRAFLASLRGEVIREKPQSASIDSNETGRRGQQDISYGLLGGHRSSSASSFDSAPQLYPSPPSPPTNEGRVAVSVPDFADMLRQTNRSTTRDGVDKAPGRQNPFDRRNRYQSPSIIPAATDGWAPGLRDKIEQAQRDEAAQKQAQMKKGNRSDFATEKKLPDQDIHAERKPCPVPGFEAWTLVVSESASGEKLHFLSRQVQLERVTLSISLLNSVMQVFQQWQYRPRRLHVNYSSDDCSSSVLHIELGGHADLEATQAPTHHPLSLYRGINNVDATILCHLEVMLQGLSDLPSRTNNITEDVSAFEAAAEVKSTLRSMQPSQDLKVDERKTISPREAGRIGALEARGKTGKNQSDGRLFSDVFAFGKPRTNEQGRPKHDTASAASAADENRQGTPVHIGRSQSGGTASTSQVKQSSSIFARLESNSDMGRRFGLAMQAGAPHKAAKPDSRKQKRNGEHEEGLSSDTGKLISTMNGSDPAQRQPIEEATPVRVDGEQAMDTAQASSFESEGDKRAVISESVSDVIDDSKSPSETKVDQVIPVLVDGQQVEEASESTRSIPAIELAAIGESHGMAREPMERGEASPNKTHREEEGEPSTPRVEDATPVQVDGEQAEGTATVVTDTDNPQISTGQKKEVESQVTKEDTSGEVLEERTPVHVDGEQAEGTTPPSDDQHLGGRDAHAQETDSERTGQAVEESTPVAIDGEQAEKKY